MALIQNYITWKSNVDKITNKYVITYGIICTDQQEE